MEELGHRVLELGRRVEEGALLFFAVGLGCLSVTTTTTTTNPPQKHPHPPTPSQSPHAGRDRSERLGRVAALLEKVSAKIEEHKGDVPMDVCEARGVRAFVCLPFQLSIFSIF